MTASVSPEDRLAMHGASIEQYEPGDTVPAQAPTVPLETTTAASFALLPTPERSFLDAAGLFPSRNVTMLSGDGGTGKSLLAMQLAVSVAGGTTWLDLGLRSGAVLYLSAEDDEQETHIRLKEVCSANGLDIARLTRLHIAVLAGRDAVLATESSKSFGIETTPLLERLRLRLRLLRPCLVVLDNLADIFSGNENSRPQVRQFIGALRKLAIEFDCVLLLLAHPSLSGLNSGSGTSGNTAWNNSVRSRLYLVREKDDNTEVDPDLRILQTMKANYGPAGGKIQLRWQNGLFVRTDTPAADSMNKEARGHKVRRVFLNLLRWHNDHGKPVSPLKSPTYAPAVFAKHPHSEAVGRREFERELDLLLHDGEIEILEEGPPSRLRRRLVLKGSLSG